MPHPPTGSSAPGGQVASLRSRLWHQTQRAAAPHLRRPSGAVACGRSSPEGAPPHPPVPRRKSTSTHPVHHLHTPSGLGPLAHVTSGRPTLTGCSSLHSPPTPPHRPSLATTSAAPSCVSNHITQAGANALHPHERKDPSLTLLHEACFLEDEDASFDIATQVLPTPPPLQQLPHRCLLPLC